MYKAEFMELAIIAAAGTFVTSWLVSVLLSRKIKKIDMVSSLKADE